MADETKSVDTMDYTEFGQDADTVKEIVGDPHKVHELLSKKRSGYGEAKSYREQLETISSMFGTKTPDSIVAIKASIDKGETLNYASLPDGDRTIVDTMINMGAISYDKVGMDVEQYNKLRGIDFKTEHTAPQEQVVDMSGLEEQVKELQAKIDLQTKMVQEKEDQLNAQIKANTKLQTKQKLLSLGVTPTRVDDAMDNWHAPDVKEGEDAAAVHEKYEQDFKERFSFYFNEPTTTTTHNQSFTKPPKKDVKLEQAKAKGVGAVVSAILEG